MYEEFLHTDVDNGLWERQTEIGLEAFEILVWKK